MNDMIKLKIPWLKTGTKTVVYGQNNGFSLIEILIAIFIFSICVLGVASMQSNALLGSRDARKLSQVTEKAVAIIEQLSMLPYNHPWLNTGTTSPAQETDGMDNNDNGIIDETDETGDFTVQWTVGANSIISATKTVSVTVSSVSSGKTVTITSLVASI